MLTKESKIRSLIQNYAYKRVVCKTVEDANSFLQELADAGVEWGDKSGPEEITFWQEDRGETYYMMVPHGIVSGSVDLLDEELKAELIYYEKEKRK